MFWIIVLGAKVMALLRTRGPSMIYVRSETKGAITTNIPAAYMAYLEILMDTLSAFSRMAFSGRV